MTTTKKPSNRSRTTYNDLRAGQTDGAGVQAWLIKDIARRSRQLTGKRQRIVASVALEQACQGDLTAAAHAMHTAEHMDRRTALTR